MTKNASQGSINQQIFPLIPERFLSELPEPPLTDALSNKTTTIRHVTGDVGRVIDHNGYYVDSNLDAFGSVFSTGDSLSNTLTTATYKYGIAPFVVSSTDMDLGNRSYTVDALGEVTAYQDAKGQNFSIFYDLLSRPTSRTEPDLTTTWVWGSSPASYNIGHLQSESAVSSAGTYSETYGYDSLGRLHSQAIQLPLQGTSTFWRYYNTYTGFLDSLQYPTSTGTHSLMLHYTYAYGLLKSIEDYYVGANHFWIAGNTNPRGQITQETTADLSTDPQIVTNRTYDAVTGWLSSNLTGVGSGGALQNESYLYDLIGNVTQRQNNNAGLTESFYYDNLYRLDHSMLGTTKNLQMAYNAMGNITSRSDIAAGATWTYDPTHKHEVTQAGSSSFTYTYDANGNAKTRNGTALVWTSYNYPSYVATSTESANFDYGPDRQRWRMIYDSAAGLETTYYATPLFEEVATSTGTDFRHYIYANGWPVVVVSRTTAGATNIRSLLVDHQGSVAAVVADSTGSSYTKESFTAYGNRRDANTWSGAPTSGDRTTMDGVTRQGYTFQTVLGSMGLNHMNGRVEDAITGRFLSADPNIPGPMNTQSYNRYSYVNNNPLTMIDPTGFAGEDARQAARQERHDANERWQWANAKLLWQMAEAGQLGFQTLGSADFACGFCRMAAQFGLTNQIAAPGRAWGKLSTPPMLRGGSITVEGGFGETTTFEPQVDWAQSQSPWWASVASPGPRGIPMLNCITTLNCDKFFSPLGALSVEGAALTRVGRWMSNSEFEIMTHTSRVVEGAGGRTSVIFPSNPAAYSAATPGSVYAEFDVPTSVLRQGGAPNWFFIPGPGITTRIFGPAPLELAPATCIVCVIGN